MGLYLKVSHSNLLKLGKKYNSQNPHYFMISFILKFLWFCFNL